MSNYFIEKGKIRVPIIYEDNHLLVVEKPVNIPVQRDSSHDLDLLNILKDDLKVRLAKPGNVYLGLVHRLDRPVGGVMVFAKTSKAASRLGEQIRSHQLQKEYFAVVRGLPHPLSNRLKHYLLKDEKKNMVQVVGANHPEGKEALLDYEVIEVNGNLTLVRIKLLTGRSHQIRVQMQALGTPLYGDQKYGPEVNRVGEQLALWSHRLTFSHPTKKELLDFTSNPPLLEPWNHFQII